MRVRRCVDLLREPYCPAGKLCGSMDEKQRVTTGHWIHLPGEAVGPADVLLWAGYRLRARPLDGAAESAPPNTRNSDRHPRITLKMFHNDAVEVPLMSKVHDVVFVTIALLLFVVVISFKPTRWFGRRRNQRKPGIHCFCCGRKPFLKKKVNKEQPFLGEDQQKEVLEIQEVKEEENKRMEEKKALFEQLWQREREKLQERGEKLHQKEERMKERERLIQLGEKSVQDKDVQHRHEDEVWRKEREQQNKTEEEQQRRNKEEEMRKQDEEEQVTRHEEELNKIKEAEWREMEEGFLREQEEFIRWKESVHQEQRHRMLEIQQKEQQVINSEHVMFGFEREIDKRERIELEQQARFDKKKELKELDIKHREFETCRQEDEIRLREQDVENMEKLVHQREEEESGRQDKFVEIQRIKEEECLCREQAVHLLELEICKRENDVQTREHEVWRCEEKERKRREHDKHGEMNQEEVHQKEEPRRQRKKKIQKNREEGQRKSDEERNPQGDESLKQQTDRQQKQHVVEGVQKQRKPQRDQGLQQVQHGVDGSDQIQDLQQTPQKRRSFPPPPPSYKKPFQMEQEEVIVTVAGEEDAMFGNDSLIIPSHKLSRNARRYTRLLQMADAGFFK